MFLAIEAAFCSAERVTMAGSMTPAPTRSTYSPVAALRPMPASESTHLVDHDRALEAGVLRDLAERLLERAQDDAHAGLLVVDGGGVEVDGVGGLQQRDAAAGDDALLERRAGRLQRVLDAVLLLLHLRLGGRADLDDGDTAGELGEALLQLLAIEVGVGVLDLAP